MSLFLDCYGPSISNFTTMASSLITVTLYCLKITWLMSYKFLSFFSSYLPIHWQQSVPFSSNFKKNQLVNFHTHTPNNKTLLGF